MGMRNLMEDTKKKLEMARSAGSKLENERRLNIPTTDMGMKEGILRARAEAMLGPRPTGPTTDMGMSRGIEKARLIDQLRKKDLTMPDWMKPQFRINSLDRQNNDPLRTGSLDSYRGNTDIKPLPSATFSGTVAKIPNLNLQ